MTNALKCLIFGKQILSWLLYQFLMKNGMENSFFEKSCYYYIDITLDVRTTFLYWNQLAIPNIEYSSQWARN